ncbi:MAG: presenilin-like A22 family membrane protease [Shewanella sp.]
MLIQCLRSEAFLFQLQTPRPQSRLANKVALLSQLSPVNLLEVVNPFNVDAQLFDTSLGVLILGGLLIATEFLILMFIFIKTKQAIKSPKYLMVLYSVAFVFVICLDGILFPVIVIGISLELVPIMISNLASGPLNSR